MQSEEAGVIEIAEGAVQQVPFLFLHFFQGITFIPEVLPDSLTQFVSCRVGKSDRKNAFDRNFMIQNQPLHDSTKRIGLARPGIGLDHGFSGQKIGFVGIED